jgi:LPXTG-motif cell wall-anchored protein
VAPPNWGLIGGIIAGCIVVGLLVYFFVRRKRGILRLS